MKWSLRFVGALGFFLFTGLLALTLLTPAVIEKSASGFIKYQVTKEVNERYESLAGSTVAEKAFELAERMGVEEASIQQKLTDNVPEKIASALASMCGYDCEKKKQLTQDITSSYLDKIKGLKIAQSTLGDIVQNKYITIIESLKLDLRIFLGSNAIVFLLFLLISFFKPRAIKHLFLPGVLLLISTMASSGIYIFGQDWFYTILYNDYMGFGYTAYLVVIFAFLMDISFNKARVTCEIMNAISHALSSAFTVSPC